MATAAATMDFGHIVHATDFSAAGEPAFNHALRLALAARSHLYVVHAEHLEPGDDADWDAFPGVRSTLARWGLLAADAEPAAVHAQLGVRVTKADVPDSDPVDGVLRFITHNQCDFLVVGTRAREDLATRVKGSVAETLARRSQIPTLFLPIGNPGFVDHATGAPRLRNVCSGRPQRAPGVRRRAGAADRGCARLPGSGPARAACGLACRRAGHLRRPAPRGPGAPHRCRRQGGREHRGAGRGHRRRPHRHGDPRGHDGVLDHLRGSTTEQVLHRAHRPLLAVPAA